MDNQNIKKYLIWITIILLVILQFEAMQIHALKKMMFSYIQQKNNVFKAYSERTEKAKNDKQISLMVSDPRELLEASEKTDQLVADELLQVSSVADGLSVKVDYLDSAVTWMLKNSKKYRWVSSATENSKISIADAQITGGGENRICNIGGTEEFCVGKPNHSALSRGLFKIDFTALIPANAKIIAAVLNLKMKKADSQSINVRNEQIFLYRLKRDWAEGNKKGTASENGESDWEMAKRPDEPWYIPGVWGAEVEVESTPSAQVKGIAYSEQEPWIQLYFTDKGITQLRSMLSKEMPNYGWLVKSNNEKLDFSNMCFYSHESEFKPFIEILYQVDE